MTYINKVANSSLYYVIVVDFHLGYHTVTLKFFSPVKMA